MADERIGIVIVADNVPGVIHQVTGVFARHNGDIRSISIIEDRKDEARTYFELDLSGDVATMLDEVRHLPVVRNVTLVQTLQKIYGKRVIIMGGGAQVGQVALGAI